MRLLPCFDALTLASRPREELFPGTAHEHALAGGRTGDLPVVLVDGTAAGVRHRRRSGKRIAVTVEPLSPLDAGRTQALEEQVERPGEVLEGTPELTSGRATVDGHA